MQSVALRLVCERETAIESFTPKEYWSIDVDLVTPDGQVPVHAHARREMHTWVASACACTERDAYMGWQSAGPALAAFENS